MYIQNFDQLATSKARADALKIVNAGLEAINTQQAISSRIKLNGNLLSIDDLVIDLDRHPHIYILGIGKAACAAGEALNNVLGDRITGGVILGNHQGNHGSLTCFTNSHPYPTTANVEAAKQAISLLKQVNPDDLVLTVITGGGSSMFCYPEHLTAEQEGELIKALNKSGATIQELNTVRKHLSLVKGGWLPTYIHGAKLVSLIFSDVPGNDLSLIASGPTVFDHTTISDAQKILDQYQILQKFNLAPFPLTETPKDPNIFTNVVNILFVTNEVAIKAMETTARNLGYQTRILSEFLQGEAKFLGETLLSPLTPKTVILAAGESTVKVTGTGIGGRNQELVLGALPALKPNQVIISIGSDGIDNSTQFAGAIADKGTLTKANESNLSREEFLQKNDSTAFFTKLGDGILTGRLPSNVSDLMLALEISA